MPLLLIRRRVSFPGRDPLPGKSRAFTLIELIVVIAIVGLLAALLFPVFSQARKNSRQSVCLSNLRQLSTATLMYVQDYDEIVPNVTGANTGVDMRGGWIYFSAVGNLWASPPVPPTFDVTQGTIYPYIRDKRVYICPSDPMGERAGLSYAINDCLHSVPKPFEGMSFGNPIRLYRYPALTMLFTEEGQGANSIVGTTNDGGLAYGDGHGDILSRRHNNGVSVSFLDGHAKWYPTDQVIAQHLQTGGGICHGE